MVIDTSALLAILLSEPEGLGFTEAIAAANRRLVGAPTLVEATAVMLARKGRQGVIALDALLARLGIEVVPMSIDAAEFAREACNRYGKGVGSPGVLYHGYVLSYGVARAEDEPLGGEVLAAYAGEAVGNDAAVGDAGLRERACAAAEFVGYAGFLLDPGRLRASRRRGATGASRIRTSAPRSSPLESRRIIGSVRERFRERISETRAREPIIGSKSR